MDYLNLNLQSFPEGLLLESWQSSFLVFQAEV